MEAYQQRFPRQRAAAFRTHSSQLRRGLSAALLLLIVCPCPAQHPAPPAPEDNSADSLRGYRAQLLAVHGPHYRDVPLETKAAHFEWELWRYHRTPYAQIRTLAELPQAPDGKLNWYVGSDESTWSGALLSALSFKYAVTRDAETLARICELIRGMQLYFDVTGVPGHVARCVAAPGDHTREEMHAVTAPDGVTYQCLVGPAKGTYNQLVGGYAQLMMLVEQDLPPDVRHLARVQLSSLVLHLVDHDYRLTGAGGVPTPYGDLTPIVASVGVPFNAQVAYQIVATGRYWPSPDPDHRARIQAAFDRLRHKHHVYYEHPLKSLIQPQRVGASPFVKGMNDRAHVTLAAFTGLQLDLDFCRRQGIPRDEKFIHQLGQTMVHSMDYLHNHHNALCNFQWAAVLAEPDVFAAVVKSKPHTTRTRVTAGLIAGVEQLRRFDLDRFVHEGVEGRARGSVWIDSYRPDSYHWKNDADKTWTVTGPPMDRMFAAIDYLHAYWLMRYFQLDQRPEVRAVHASVL